MRDIEYSHQNKLCVIKMGLTGLQQFVAIVYLPLSFRSLDQFCCFTCVYEGHFMLCFKGAQSRYFKNYC